MLESQDLEVCEFSTEATSQIATTYLHQIEYKYF